LAAVAAVSSPGRAPAAGERVCEVHDVALENTRVPIHYGLTLPDREEYRAARAASFPNAARFIGGGCVVDEDNTHARVLTCPQCNDAEEIWLENNDRYERGPSAR